MLHNSGPIAVRVDAQELQLRPEQAVAIGLLVNELVTNALKHAFPGDRPGMVKVSFGGTSKLELRVEDNGVGCSSGVQERIGSKLTKLLASQLGATLTREDAEPGCRVTVAFDAA